MTQFVLWEDAFSAANNAEGDPVFNIKNAICGPISTSTDAENEYYVCDFFR